MRPLILKHEMTREPRENVPYTYDEAEDISFVKTNGKRVPYIKVDDCESGSLTEVKGEPVDVDMLELCTKTFTQRESDD